MACLERLKSHHNLTDSCTAELLGAFATFLPPSNVLKSKLQNSSMSAYYFNKLFSNLSSHESLCSIFKIEVCIKGCYSFVGQYQNANECPVCSHSRVLIDIRFLYYFPLRERLTKLLHSDLLNLFYYPDFKNKSNPLYWEDVYDGETFKWFKDQMHENAYLIVLQWCWDGADAFNFSGKSFWPSTVAILNFPIDARKKMNLGLHLVTLCDGMYDMYLIRI